MTGKNPISPEKIDQLFVKLNDAEEAIRDLIDEANLLNDCYVSATIFMPSDEVTEYADDVYVKFMCADLPEPFERYKLIDLLREELDWFGIDHNEKVESKTGSLGWHPAQGEKLKFLLVMLLRAYEEWETRFKNLSDEEMKTATLEAVSK